MIMNTGILRDVHVDKYGFTMKDLTVAAMIKAYLQQLTVEAAPEELERIVSPGVKHYHGGTVKSNGLQQEQWITIDGAEMAEMIDRARVAAAISADAWVAQKGERLLSKTIEYMRDELFPALDGKQYVESMPVEVAEFITDCWLAIA